VQLGSDQGQVVIRPEKDRSFLVTLEPRDPSLFIPRLRCRTTFSPDLIEYLLERVGFPWLCECIARFEDPESVPGVLKSQVLSYFAAADFKGRRLLDFGCGAGASSLVLGAMLPETEVIGVELGPEKVEIASRVGSFRKLSNVRFLCSPAGDRLPDGIGQFDFVMLSAVYEHLLPNERRTVMPLLWSVLRPGGAILINQTPYRYFPYEHHSTGIWFVNYMPDVLAHFVARHFSRRNAAINRSRDWNTHLRGGLRGGTEWELIRNLTRGNTSEARILQPGQNGLRDRADYWLSCTSQRYRTPKGWLAAVFRLTDRLWGTVPSVNLDVVIQKRT
jgi:2-polyprenyl-3-methyl-5-hydroxy-6-metoxy-1,4-benzoquinol methylase